MPVAQSASSRHGSDGGSHKASTQSVPREQSRSPKQGTTQARSSGWHSVGTMPWGSQSESAAHGSSLGCESIRPMHHPNEQRPPSPTAATQSWSSPHSTPQPPSTQVAPAGQSPGSKHGNRQPPFMPPVGPSTSGGAHATSRPPEPRSRASSSARASARHRGQPSSGSIAHAPSMHSSSAKHRSPSARRPAPDCQSPPSWGHPSPGSWGRVEAGVCRPHDRTAHGMSRGPRRPPRPTLSACEASAGGAPGSAPSSPEPKAEVLPRSLVSTSPGTTRRR